jgi:hypothetical protein
MSKIAPVPITLEEGEKGNLLMNVFKLMLLTLFRLAFFGVLKVALVIYIMFLPNAPVAGIAQEGDAHTGDTAVSAAREAEGAVVSLKGEALFS